MLFPRAALEGIARGEVTLAFRRWERPRVRPGTRLRTGIGVVAIESVAEVDPAGVSEAEARLAGYADLADLLHFLHRPTRNRFHRDRPARIATGAVYRIGLRHAGEDPRIALRDRGDLAADELDALIARLDRLDRASRDGPWTAQVLRLIADRPHTRAADLAESLDREKHQFKLDVRKLKELGLTESLDLGYRISARGRTVLRRLDGGD